MRALIKKSFENPGMCFHWVPCINTQKSSNKVEKHIFFLEKHCCFDPEKLYLSEHCVILSLIEPSIRFPAIIIKFTDL